jgi:hypothetical protein
MITTNLFLNALQNLMQNGDISGILEIDQKKEKQFMQM